MTQQTKTDKADNNTTQQTAPTLTRSPSLHTGGSWVKKCDGCGKCVFKGAVCYGLCYLHHKQKGKKEEEGQKRRCRAGCRSVVTGVCVGVVCAVCVGVGAGKGRGKVCA